MSEVIKYFKSTLPYINSTISVFFHLKDNYFAIQFKYDTLVFCEHSLHFLWSAFIYCIFLLLTSR